MVLYALAAILLVAWLLGVSGVHVLGWMVHGLLILAIIMFVMGLMRGRGPVSSSDVR